MLFVTCVGGRSLGGGRSTIEGVGKGYAKGAKPRCRLPRWQSLCEAIASPRSEGRYGLSSPLGYLSSRRALSEASGGYGLGWGTL